MIDVSPTQLQTIQAILKRIAPTCEARVFGSRYQWTAKDYSDLDLAMVGDGKLPFKKLSALRTAFEESDLPYRVDVLDWHAISPEFQKVIERGYEVIQEAKMDVSSNGWVKQKLGEVCEINQSKRNSNWNYPIIEYIDISSVGVGYFVEEPSRIPTQEAPSRAQRLVQDGDTIISTVRPNRRSMLYIKSPKQNTVVSTGFAVLHPKKIDPRFLYYVVFNQEFTDHLAARADGSAYPAVLPEVIAGTEIDLPPLPEQRAIAGILSALDDKIELNRRMNRTLESMARGVFREMMKDELGRMKVGTVGEDFNLTMGQSPPGETYNEEGKGTPFFQGRADFGFRYPENRVYCTAPTRFAKAGDTLVSVRAPVGDVNMAKEECAIGRGVAAVRHKTGSRSYTYYAMKSLQEDFGKFEAEGTVFGSINKADFQNLETKIPTTEQVERFEKICYPIDQMIENNEKESRTLASLRDSLLPKLMRGEVSLCPKIT
jgi:type I restriction enzyme S subunit